jgi:hypothetical protein
MSRFLKASALLLCCCAIVGVASAQTIRVDITPGHSTNSFVPTKTLGAGIDRIPVKAIDDDLNPATLKQVFAAGWQPITYRQNTELMIEAWHWNPVGTWSDPSGKGYFTGSSTPTNKTIRHSYGYALPHRGFTRNYGVEGSGYSRLTDGDLNSYWKSNPYLTSRYTGEDDSLHPQWVTLDLGVPQLADSIRIAWAEPYAKNFVVQYWTGKLDPIAYPTLGVWQTFPHGGVVDGHGGTQTIRLANIPVPVQYIRVWMTKSSNTCDSHGPSDPRNCVGYAIRELYFGTTTADGKFHDMVYHTADQDQTATLCSSVDPWHEPSDLINTRQAQVGFDLFYSSGVTRGLPAMIPISMVYGNPENSAAEIAYIEKRKYPISYVEMGEEVDGQFMSPEDYGALYIQWAKALHKVDPNLKLGGPAFEGVNDDILTWPDANGDASWFTRFLNYLRDHHQLDLLAFFSFEHYPYTPCKIPWSSLYDEPKLMSHIMQVWRQDGLPANVPMFITESNLSSSTGETYEDIFAGLWLANYVGSFLTSGGNALYFFHDLPLQMERGCDNSLGTFGMFTVDANYKILQRLSQFYAARLINTQWVEPGDGVQRVYPASSDVQDGAGHSLVMAYALHRPDGQWAVMIVNNDQWNAHKVRIAFTDKGKPAQAFSGPVQLSIFGRAQYAWHPVGLQTMAHYERINPALETVYPHGEADPDGPILHETKDATSATEYDLPAASVVIVRGTMSPSSSQPRAAQ